jgi:hypothetical protein
MATGGSYLQDERAFCFRKKSPFIVHGAKNTERNLYFRTVCGCTATSYLGAFMSQAVLPRPTVERRATISELPVRSEAHSGGVSWQAVFGGAFAASALSLILLALGSGLGFSAVSPWSGMGANASTIGKGAIGWFILIQILAASMGGYLAGRLRTKWVSVHTDEVYFRDTANGFLAWAVGLVVTAAFLASAVASVAGRPASTEPTAASSGPHAYYTDTLLRSTAPASANDVAQRAEVERIFAHDLAAGSMPLADSTYLGRMVSARSGVNQADAENKVVAVFGEAQQAMERTRKTLAHVSLWMFIALLAGAFCSSFAGTIGGKQRDHVPV